MLTRSTTKQLARGRTSSANNRNDPSYEHCFPTCVALLLTALALLASTSSAADDITRTVVSVPIDHTAPGIGHYEIVVEFGAPFDANKPTVLLVADGQQFYVREGAIAKLQSELFGPELNVAGIVGRGSLLHHETARSQIVGSDNIDWAAAWRLFRAEQWIEDIEAVREHILGEAGKAMLFGRSGGGYLVHQYLTVYGDKVSRAFTSAPVSNPWTAYAGLDSDRFWSDLEASDPDTQARILAVLERGHLDRRRIALAFQRQNFFVSHDEINAARLELLGLLEGADQSALDNILDAYQVPAIENFLDSEAAIPSRVRLFEFAIPFAQEWEVSADRLDPDIEVVLYFASPLIEAMHNGTLTTAPDRDYEPDPEQLLHPEVLVLAARWDHAVDYRGALALAARYPHSTYWLADDTHTFDSLTRHGHYAALLQSFLLDGPGSNRFRTASTDAKALRWRGR